MSDPVRLLREGEAICHVLSPLVAMMHSSRLDAFSRVAARSVVELRRVLQHTANDTANDTVDADWSDAAAVD